MTKAAKPKATPKTKAGKFVIIDGNAVIHRAFHAVPPLTTKDGVVVNALYGFMNIMFKVLNDTKPTHFAVAFDVKGKTFRHDQYKEYKATRKVQVPELYAQIPMAQDLCKSLGITIYTLQGYEADDIIGTVTRQIPKDMKSYIVTGDMDLTQLVDDHTFVYAMRKGVSETEIFDAAAVAHKFGGLTPEQIIDYKGLRGDPSDNIPGVKGIGEKTALALLTKYGSVENVIKHVDTPSEVIKGAVQKKLQEGKDMAVLSKQLATIERHAPMKFDLDETELVPFDRDQLLHIIQEYEFKSLLKYLPEAQSETAVETTAAPVKTSGKKLKALTFADISAADPDSTSTDEVAQETTEVHIPKTDATYTLVDSKKKAEDLAKKLSKQKVFAFDTETTGLDALQCELVGVSVSWKAGTGYYIPAEYCAPLWPVMESKKVHKVGHNAKFDWKVLKATQGITVESITYDTMLAAYVINPGTRGYSLDDMALSEFSYTMMPFTELVGKGKNEISIREVPLEKLSFYAAEDADFTWRLYEALQARVKKAKLEKVLQMELDLIPVLGDMELAGIVVDTKYLAAMSVDFAKRIKKLEKQIHKLAGKEFNISSPLQLSEILFDTLAISTKGIKKTKTGFSTAAPELEKLKGQHEIIDLISQYREVTKLKSTYIDALPEMVNPKTKRVHTTYNQTVAATGRLSSLDPNLQNIPIRTELGQDIRRAFVAPKGKVLLSLDYSQIELRVVAHMVDDNSFVKAFKDGADIHKRTAAETQGVTEKEVTYDMRRNAKSVNFGLLYGMGVYGLMRDTGLSYPEAQEYLDNYFKLHPQIKNYIADTKVLAAKQGYVETLFGRKRYLPDVLSGIPAIRAGAERAAINSPIQGTAADIIKMAMLDVAKSIEAGKIKATMLLQVHDELVFEVEKKHAESEAKKIQDIMEEVYKLKVPLVVDVAIGTNWQDAD